TRIRAGLLVPTAWLPQSMWFGVNLRCRSSAFPNRLTVCGLLAALSLKRMLAEWYTLFRNVGWYRTVMRHVACGEIVRPVVHVFAEIRNWSGLAPILCAPSVRCRSAFPVFVSHTTVPW